MPANHHPLSFSAACALALAAACLPATAQVTFTGHYTQNFDSLPASGAYVWTDNSTLPGWSLVRSDGSAATILRTGNGSASTGGFYSFGAIPGTAGADSSDRALGSLATLGYTGAAGNEQSIVLGLTNVSSQAWQAIEIFYRGEEWRDPGTGGSQDSSLVVTYGFGQSYTDVTTWYSLLGNFTGYYTLHTADPAWGSTGALFSRPSGALTSGASQGWLTWDPGVTLWIRWTDTREALDNEALAIDDVSIRGALPAVPEPTTGGLMLAGAATLAWRLRGSLQRRP